MGTAAVPASESVTGHAGRMARVVCRVVQRARLGKPGPEDQDDAEHDREQRRSLRRDERRRPRRRRRYDWFSHFSLPSVHPTGVDRKALAGLLAHGSSPVPCLPGSLDPVALSGRLAAYSCGGSCGFGSRIGSSPTAFPFHPQGFALCDGEPMLWTLVNRRRHGEQAKTESRARRRGQSSRVFPALAFSCRLRNHQTSRRRR